MDGIKGYIAVYRANILLIAFNSLHLWRFWNWCSSSQVFLVLDLNTCRGNEAKIKQKTKIKNDLKSYDVNNCQISRVKKKKRNVW